MGVHSLPFLCIEIENGRNLKSVETSLLRGIGARYSSVVRAFAHSTMGRRIDPSWWTHLAISRSNQCSTIGVYYPVCF